MEIAIAVGPQNR